MPLEVGLAWSVNRHDPVAGVAKQRETRPRPRRRRTRCRALRAVGCRPGRSGPRRSRRVGTGQVHRSPESSTQNQYVAVSMRPSMLVAARWSRGRGHRARGRPARRRRPWKRSNHSAARSASASVAGRSLPGTARGGVSSPSSKSRVCWATSTTSPCSRASSSANAWTAGSAPLTPPTSSPRSCSTRGQGPGGAVGHRQQEERVRRSACRPHRHDRRSPRRRRAPPPTTVEPVLRARDAGGVLVTVAARHGGDHRADDRVCRQQVVGHGEEGSGVGEELDRELDGVGHASARYRCDCDPITPISWAA